MSTCQCRLEIVVKAVLLRHLTRLASSHPVLSRSVQEKILLPKTNALAFPIFIDEVAYHFSENLYCKFLIFFQNSRHYRCNSWEPIIWSCKICRAQILVWAETLSLRFSPMPRNKISIWTFHVVHDISNCKNAVSRGTSFAVLWYLDALGTNDRYLRG